MDAERANKKALRAMTEVQWQATVLTHADRAGWMTYYIPDAMWRRAFVSKIPLHLGNRGFPDLVLLRGSRLLFRELKRMGGSLSEHQEKWRDALVSAGADWDTWYPNELDTKVIPDLWEGNES